jgi:hypothetical protein
MSTQASLGGFSPLLPHGSDQLGGAHLMSIGRVSVTRGGRCALYPTRPCETDAASIDSDTRERRLLSATRRSRR